MKKAYNVIDKIVHKISLAGLAVSATVLFAVVVMIFVDVFKRYVLKDPMSGQQELAELGTVVIVYFGLPYATRIRSHVRVEPVTGMFSPSARSILYGILDFVITAFMALLTAKVFQQAMNLTATPGNATLGLRLPYFYLYFIASVGAAIATVEFLLDGVRYIMEGVAPKLEKGSED